MSAFDLRLSVYLSSSHSAYRGTKTLMRALQQYDSHASKAGWYMTPYNLVIVYRLFGEMYCFQFKVTKILSLVYPFLHDDGVSTFLRNVG
jgi:hypothetical protein